MTWEKLLCWVLGGLTLVQIAPIKINPWSWLCNALKQILFGEIMKKLETVSTELSDLRQDVETEKVSSKRWRIMDFANSCLQGRRHTKEEWEHCLTELAWYEDYCERNRIPNGVMVEAGKYLRATYQVRLQKKDFL